MTKIEQEYDRVLIINDLFLAETGTDFRNYKMSKMCSRDFALIRQAYFWFIHEYTNLTPHEIGVLFGYSDKGENHPAQAINLNLSKYNDRINLIPSDIREHERLLKKYATYTIKPHQVSDNPI